MVYIKTTILGSFIFSDFTFQQNFFIWWPPLWMIIYYFIYASC